MTRHMWSGLLMVVLSVSMGCFGDLNNRNNPQIVNAPVKLSPASELAHTTAYGVFSELFAANPEIAAQLSPLSDPNFRPEFKVVGSQGVSIYHRGTELYITEGLVNRCPPEGKDGKYKGKLAAVLASELSKMVVEASNQKFGQRLNNGDEVFATQVPGDSSDQSATAQRAIADKNNAKRTSVTRVPNNQDPKALARNYLTKANYSPTDLLQVEALIRKAEANPELQKQVNPDRSNSMFPTK